MTLDMEAIFMFSLAAVVLGIFIGFWLGIKVGVDLCRLNHGDEQATTTEEDK